MVIKLYSVLCLTVISSFISFSAGQQCDKNGLRRFDTTFAKLLTLGGSGRSFPEDKQDQLKKYCDQSFEYIKDIDEYKNKCMKQLPKQVTGVMVYSVKTVINKYCKRDSKKLTELIDSTPCANRAKKEFDQCYTILIDNFQGAINAKEKLRVPYGCCEYNQMFNCIRERAIKNKGCNEAQIDVMINFFKELFGNAVDLLCTDYVEGSDKCEKLGKPPKKKKSQRRTKSFMLPLMDTLSSLNEQ